MGTSKSESKKIIICFTIYFKISLVSAIMQWYNLDMITHDSLYDAYCEQKQLLNKMEKAAELGPEGTIAYRQGSSDLRTPYLILGSRQSRVRQRLDPENTELIQALQDKTFARRMLPKIRKNVEALEHFAEYQELDLYGEAARMGPEFRRCADLFLGRKNGRILNPAFDQLRERQNPYPFGPTAISTSEGMFRSKSEAMMVSMARSFGCDLKYEPAIIVAGRTLYPDIAVNRPWRMDVGLIEHHGLMDDPRYRAKKIEDLRDLMNNGYCPGINLLITSENSAEPFDAALIRKLLEAFCQP